METIGKDLVSTGGPLGVLVIVVWLFLKAIHTMSNEHRAWMEQMLQTHALVIQQMTTEGLVAREASRICIERNTGAMIENTRAMQGLAITVSSLDRNGKPA